MIMLLSHKKFNTFICALVEANIIIWPTVQVKHVAMDEMLFIN